MAWRVRAVPNGNRPGFRRSGRFFSRNTWTLLDDSEMTEAIRQERMLQVERVEAPETAPEPAPETADTTEAPEPAEGRKRRR